MNKAIVIGGGIAGSSVAYFLAQQGIQVTLIDAGIHTASYVPSALVNPVRGQSGKIDPQAIQGMQFTWQLLSELKQAGYDIPHHQSGVIRPLPNDKIRRKFEQNLPPELDYHWIKPSAPLTNHWKHALHLPEGGWIDGQVLVTALQQAAKVQLIQAKALSQSPHQVEIEGQTLSTDLVFCCGGSLGSSWAGEQRTHRMGSMLLLDRPISPQPLSFGTYLAPAKIGSVLGGTFEAPAQQWQPPHLPLHSLAWLLDKGSKLSDLSGLNVTGIWTGSRLSELKFGPDEQGVWHFSGLDSKGFLLGPLLAKKLVERALGYEV